MLQLLADIMMYILRAPLTLMNYLNQFMYQRLATEKLVTTATGEVKTVSGVRKFLRVFFLVLFWTLVIALFVGLLVLLWWLNERWELERVLGGPWPAVRPYWLPLLLLLFCGACFIGYQLFRSLGPDREIVEFADLEEAWTDARAALIEAGIDVTAAPVFLVLGRTASNLHALLSAAKVSFGVQQVPLKANAPLQVYANRQAIYVAALDASLLSRQAELLFEAEQVPAAETTKPGSVSVFEEPPEPTKEPDAGAPPPVDPLLATKNLLADAEPTGGVGLATAPVATEPMPWEQHGHRRMPALSKRTEEVDKYQRRLRYLARRIGRERAPYCSLNGVLLLIPFDALENDEDASQIATMCQSDLQVLHDSARVRCPAVVLVTDLETAPGYAALSDLLDLDRRTRLFGQELPLLPDLKPEELPRMIDGSLAHFNNALTHWIFRLFDVEKSERDSAVERIANNSHLFELLGAIRQREAGLNRVLNRILIADPPLEYMVAGFYLAATGANPARDQAFVPGIFQQLVQNQNAVSWTDEALAEEADFQRWTTYGYAALALFCIAVFLIIFGRWQMLRWY